MTHPMEKKYDYILILAIGIAGLVLVPVSQQVSAVKIDGLWKLNANGEKGDLNIMVTPDTPSSLNKDLTSGRISGTVHWFGSGPGGDTHTEKVIGFWDAIAQKIVFLTENKVVFDTPRSPDNMLICNTVEKPSANVLNDIKTELNKTTPDPKDIMKVLDELETCHGRDVAYTGYLFGQPPIGGVSHPYEMAGVEQTFGGGSTGAGGYGERNTFGWCATQVADLCGGYNIASAMNATSMSNTTSAMNATSMSNMSATAK